KYGSRCLLPNPGGDASCYQASFAIRERLVQSDSSNAIWQRDVATANERQGDVHLRLANKEQARQAFQAALDKKEQPLAGNPGDADPGCGPSCRANASASSIRSADRATSRRR